MGFFPYFFDKIYGLITIPGGNGREFLWANILSFKGLALREGENE